ncbi:MAG: VanZ family protein [Proteobacteria bacterium]|nr:VanZ family protein [Pseudomonadota bacterium]MBU1581898.1 VanZ family protein [Pseudomonadota bacterium]MBU2456177.1 VanZ family protein [Pseudomonadota bacterium]MBU2628772.1 VanZ family protein [Pseudomonadota bacterium]
MKKIILFCLLAVVTVACHTYVDRYKKSGPEMLTDNWKVYAPLNNKAEIKENSLFLVSLDENKSVKIQQEVEVFEQGSILQLSADMKSENILPGKKPWNLARLLLVQNDGQKDRWNFQHQVASLTGTREWDAYSQTFTIGLETKKIRVAAELGRCSGTFQLKNIRLYPVSQTLAYTWVKKSILALWGIFAVFLLGSCFLQGGRQLILQVMLVLAFVAIIVGTTMPADMKLQVSNQIETQFHATSNVLEDQIPWDLSKVGHFCFFAVFGLVLSLLLRQKPVLVVMIHLLLLAGGTELAQFFIDGRTPLFWDFGIDAAGGLLGIILHRVPIKPGMTGL